VHDLLTDLAFIQSGVTFPPSSQKNRLKQYDLNFKHYEGSYNEDRQLVVMTREGYKIYDSKMITDNYFKLITDKFVGLLLTEKPMLSVTDKDKQQLIHDMVLDTNFWYKFQQVAKSFSMLGDGIFNVYKDANGGNTNWMNPSVVYKIVSEHDIDEVKCYLVAYEISETSYLGTTAKSDVKYIRFIAHYKGYYSEIVHSYNGTSLGSPVEYTSNGLGTIPLEGRTVETGLSDFAIQTVHNSRSIRSIYGVSDYDSIKPLVYEVEKRLTLGSIVIDKNIEGILIVPQGMLRTNELTGKTEFKGEGSIVTKPANADDPKYIAPDGKTEANEHLITQLIDELVKLSEYGKVFLFGEYKNASGEALKVMLKGALDKVSRQIDSLDFTVKKVLCLMAEYNGVSVTPKDINIGWQDGIAESLKTVTDAIKSMKESNTMSLRTLLMRFFNFTSEQVDDEFINIKNEQKDLGGTSNGQA
jgi:hypothetical protein